MRTRTIALLGLLAFSLTSFSQNPPQKSSYDPFASQTKPVVYPEKFMKDLAALRDAALSDDYAWQQVAHLTENIGPRPDGSPQAQAAVEYVAEELCKAGLEVRLEEVSVPHWVRGTETAELVEFPGQAAGTSHKIVLTALAGNVPTPADGLTAEVVVAHTFDALKALGRDKVAGKIVVFDYRFDARKAAGGNAFDAYGDAVIYRARGAKAAAELGAVGALVRSVGDADYRLPHTGWSLPAGIPQGALSSEDADLIAHLASQGKVRMHLVLTAQNGPEVKSYNVVADLKGSEHPEEIVIVSGHLDSWDLGTGAIDDAAGVAAAMATAHLVQQLHLHPRRTIRVIAWMDEENGGHGHDTYAKVHAGEVAQHVAAIESDSGAAHPFGFQAKISAASLPLLLPVQDVLSTFGANSVRVIDSSPDADIAPLAKAGVPSLGLWQDGRTYFHYHHTAADTLDKIVPQELRENAAAMAVMGYALAEMPEKLPR